jgi:ABC-type transporter Mla subunit MlaD
MLVRTQEGQQALNTLMANGAISVEGMSAALKLQRIAAEVVNDQIRLLRSSTGDLTHVVDTFSLSTDLATSAMHGLGPVLKGVGDVARDSAGIVGDAVGQMDALKEKAGLVPSPLEAMTGNFSGLGKIAEDVQGPLGRTRDLFDLIGSSGTSAADVIGTFHRTLMDVRGSLNDVIQSLTGYSQMLDEVVQRQDVLTAALGNTAARFQDLNTAITQVTGTDDAHRQKIGETESKLQGLIPTLTNTQTALDLVKSSTLNLVREEENLRRIIDLVNPRLDDQKTLLDQLRGKASLAAAAITNLASAENTLTSALRNVQSALAEQTSTLGPSFPTDPFTRSRGMVKREANLISFLPISQPFTTPVGGFGNLSGVLDKIAQVLSNPNLPSTFVGAPEVFGAVNAFNLWIHNDLPRAVEEIRDRMGRMIDDFKGLSGSIGSEIQDLLMSALTLPDIFSEITSTQTALALAEANQNYEGILGSVQKLVELNKKKYELESAALTEQISLNRRLMGDLRSVRESIGSTLLDFQFGTLAREIGGANIIDQTRAAREHFQNLVRQARGAAGENLVGIAQDVQRFAGTLLELGKLPARQVPEFRNLFDEVFGALREVQGLVGSQQSILGAETAAFESQLPELQQNLVQSLTALQQTTDSQTDRLQYSLDNLESQMAAVHDQLHTIINFMQGPGSKPTQELVDMLRRIMNLLGNGSTVIQIDGKEIAKVTRHQSRLGTPVLTDRR